MVALAIGWRKHDKDPLWLSGEKGEFTGFFTAYSHPRWEPACDADLALRAAESLCDRRRVDFRLERKRDRTWRASFFGNGRFSEVSSTQAHLCWAICDAIIQLSESPDLETLFPGGKRT